MADDIETRNAPDQGGFPLRLFAAMAALVLALRSALVLSLADVFFYGEELEKGAAAKAMLDGLPVEHFRLAYHYYEGGGFAASHLKALCFLLVGENLLAHKLAALVMIILVLAAGLRLVNHHFGRRAAFVFGLLFALAPGSMQQLSLLHLGIHFEALLFVFLVLDQGARLAFASPGPAGSDVLARNPRAFAFLGFVTGLGIWFNYQLAPLAVYMALVLLLCRALDLRRVAAGLAGTVLGLGPLLWMASQVGGEVLDIHGVALLGVGDGTPPETPVLETLSAFLGSMVGQGPLLSRVSATLVPGALIVSLLIAARRGDLAPAGLLPGRRLLLVSGALLSLLATYLASPFLVGAVYHPFLLMRFAPLWGLAAVLIAGACGPVLGPLPRRRSAATTGSPWGAARFAAGLVLGVCLIGGLAGTGALMAAGKASGPRAAWGLLRRAPGVSYAGYFPKFMGHLEGSPEERLALLLAFDPQGGRLQLEAAAGQAVLRRDEVTVDELLTLATEVGASPAILLGSGPVQVARAGGDMGAAVRAAHIHPQRAHLLEALGRFAGRWRWTRKALVESVPDELETYGTHAQMAPWWRGLGHRVHAAFPLDPGAAHNWLSHLPDAVRGPAATGWEAARLGISRP